ncbi:MAG: permease prefix domain 1-containing protein [Pseudonocardia sp.]
MGARRGVAEPAFEAYLAAVAARLIGPRHTRAAILDELRDGLHTAAAAHRAHGMTPAASVDTTLAEFGGPATVADAFADELATAQARRTGLAYLLTGPLVGTGWLLLLAPHGLNDGPGAITASIPALPLIATACVAALLVLAGTGRLARWIRPKPQQLRDLTILLALACMAADLLMLTVLIHITTPEPDVFSPLAAIAATASLIRLACSVTALGRRTLPAADRGARERW